MTTGEVWVQRHTQAVMNTFGPPKVALERGSGAEVWDADGNRYLDLYAGIAVNALGHAHPRLVAAVADQLATLGHVSNFFATAPQVELAERLVAMVCGGDPFAGAPAGAGKVFLTNSGTEANEAALKLTRRTGRTHLVAAEGAFHGRTMGALALTAKEAYRAPFEPLPGHVTFVPYGDKAALAAAVTDETAAIVLEPVQGEAGVVVPPRDYLAAARRIADEHGALLWLDEVQTGAGRTGDWFAHRNAALTDPVMPDVVTLAMPTDTEAVSKSGLIKDGWEKRLPNDSLPYSSTIVFVVRKRDDCSFSFSIFHGRTNHDRMSSCLLHGLLEYRTETKWRACFVRRTSRSH